jgi:hypothetical protein
MMPLKFNLNADIHFIYYYCNSGDFLSAAEEYQQLPERTASNRGCFSTGAK